MLEGSRMKAAGDKGTEATHDFCTSTAASANAPRAFRFSPLDIFILSVLFLEAAVLLRLFLAR
jgi:hypothetical protein